jgi:type III restriction enzyme
LPDESTQLRRSTIEETLKGLNLAVFDQFKRNPEDFLSKAATLINEQTAIVIIEHLSYSPLEGTHRLDTSTEVVVYSKIP